MKHRGSSHSKWPTHTIGIEWPSPSEDQLRAWLKYKNLPEAQRKRYQKQLREIQRAKQAQA